MDGTQDPFGPDVLAADVLGELADEILRVALTTLCRGLSAACAAGSRAGRPTPPLRQQREREEATALNPARSARGCLGAARGDPRAGTYEAELPSEIDDARQREAFLDAPAARPAGPTRELSEYRSADPKAQRMFDELMEHSCDSRCSGRYFRSWLRARRCPPEDIGPASEGHARRAQRLIEMQRAR